MPSERVLLLFNQPVLPERHPHAISEHEIVYVVESVSKYLGNAGYRVSQLGIDRDPGLLIQGLRRHKPDVVVNLFEGTGDHGDTEAYAAGILEWYGLPFTGSPSRTLCLARHKHLAKHLLRGAGLPTPDFIVVKELPLRENPLGWPVIVKPAQEDASVGVDQGSVVTDLDSLQQRVEKIFRQYGPPVLVEEYINGREFSIGVVETPELKILPISEITFVDKGPGYWPIVTFDAKWRPHTQDYQATPPVYPAAVTPRLGERMVGLAWKAFRLLGCRDYARVDFRARVTGHPYILEVNPNPDFSPEAGLAGCLEAIGISHEAFTLQIVKNALARKRRRSRAPNGTAKVIPQLS